MRYLGHKKVVRKKEEEDEEEEEEEEEEEKDFDEINGDPQRLHVADHQLDLNSSLRRIR